jgi:hypothetical protein
MIPSLQYANEGTEYNSNMSSEVTIIDIRVSLTRISGMVSTYALWNVKDYIIVQSLG